MWYEDAQQPSCSVARRSVCWQRFRARAGIYYVTVAGLGGEPDYEQRFTAMANDLDKLLESSGGEAHVFTLTGAQATRAQLTEALGEVAREAKPEDDFVLILIGHGSFDGVEYKFNLVGPGHFRRRTRRRSATALPRRRQLIVNTTSSSGGSIGALEKPGPRGDRRHQNRHREKRHRLRALLGRGAARSRPPTSTRTTPSARWKPSNTPTARPPRSTIRKSAWPPSTPSSRTPARASPSARLPPTPAKGMFLSTFTLLRIGAAQRAANDPAKRELLAKKEELEQKIDTLKYQKAAMDQEDYKKQLTDALLELARVQEELDK